MIGCLGESRATQESDVVARAVIVVRSHWLVWAVAGGPRTSSALRARPGWPANRVDQDRPLRPVQ
jgi:hypothetical protein